VYQVGIIGYSHGVGATYDLSAALQNDLCSYRLQPQFTAYIDAGGNRSALAETRGRRKLNSLNQWQSGPGDRAKACSCPGGYLTDQRGRPSDNVDSNSDLRQYFTGFLDSDIQIDSALADGVNR